MGVALFNAEGSLGRGNRICEASESESNMPRLEGGSTELKCIERENE